MAVMVVPGTPLATNAVVSGPATSNLPSLDQMMSMQPSGSTRYSPPVGCEVHTTAPRTRLDRSRCT